MNIYQHTKPFILEGGATINSLQIGYHTWGTLNESADNVIWICHALTANSDAADWWSGVIGAKKVLDTEKYFIVCANILGSCYGTTGPQDINVDTKKPWYYDFPFVTIRDIVAALDLLRINLRIKRIHLLAGGSMGGYQALEWSIMEPALINYLFLIATSSKESAWGIAIHTVQRLAIEADGSWGEQNLLGGSKGLKVARAVGMITYRSYEAFAQTQTDSDPDKKDDFKASSYIKYQGEKLVQRFNAFSYWTLTKSMDTHNLSRSRNSDLKSILKTINAKTLVVGIESDIICPITEQEFLATHIPHATFKKIQSLYGHDGFLVETTQIANCINHWLSC